jgi:hypothetical protein
VVTAGTTSVVPVTVGPVGTVTTGMTGVVVCGVAAGVVVRLFIVVVSPIGTCVKTGVVVVDKSYFFMITSILRY